MPVFPKVKNKRSQEQLALDPVVGRAIKMSLDADPLVSKGLRDREGLATILLARPLYSFEFLANIQPEI